MIYSEEDMQKHRWYKIGNRVKFLRKRYNLSRENLAKKSGLPVEEIVQAEEGHCDSETVWKIACGLQIKGYKLIDHAGETARQIERGIFGMSRRAFYKRNDGEKIGKKIRELRKENGYDQSVLAEVLGVTETLISSMELRGSSIRQYYVEELANFFGVDIEYLLEGVKDGLT